MISDRTRITMHPTDFLLLSALQVIGAQSFRTLKGMMELSNLAIGESVLRLQTADLAEYSVLTGLWQVTGAGTELFKNRRERLQITEK